MRGIILALAQVNGLKGESIENGFHKPNIIWSSDAYVCAEGTRCARCDVECAQVCGVSAMQGLECVAVHNLKPGKKQTHSHKTRHHTRRSASVMSHMLVRVHQVQKQSRQHHLLRDEALCGVFVRQRKVGVFYMLSKNVGVGLCWPQRVWVCSFSHSVFVCVCMCVNETIKFILSR